MPRLQLPGFDDLKPEQRRIFRLPDEGRHLVTGPPGTGKTIIALIRAIAMNSRNNPPVVIVFNRMLLEYCRQMLRDRARQVRAMTFHQWIFQDFRQRYGQPPPEVRRFEYDWNRIIDICAESPEIVPDNTPLMVDEGQDLPPAFYEYLSLHFSNLIVFADENQRLERDENSTLNAIANQLGIEAAACYAVKANMRNTREIAEVAGHFYVGTSTGRPDLPDRSGPKPYLLTYEDFSFMAQRTINHARLHPHALVAVITSTNQNLDRARRELEPLCRQHKILFSCYSSQNRSRIDFDRPGIVVLNIQSVKGLEFDSAVLADLHAHLVRENAKDHLMRLYVACSRPRDRLYLAHDRNHHCHLLADMPGDDLLGRHTLIPKVKPS